MGSRRPDLVTSFLFLPSLPPSPAPASLSPRFLPEGSLRGAGRYGSGCPKTHDQGSCVVPSNTCRRGVLEWWLVKSSPS